MHDAIGYLSIVARAFLTQENKTRIRKSVQFNNAALCRPFAVTLIDCKALVLAANLVHVWGKSVIKLGWMADRDRSRTTSQFRNRPRLCKNKNEPPIRARKSYLPKSASTLYRENDAKRHELCRAFAFYTASADTGLPSQDFFLLPAVRGAVGWFFFA